MSVFRRVISVIVLFASLSGGALPPNAQWLCLDPDGGIAFETNESRAACCERWHAAAVAEPLVAYHGYCTVHGTRDGDCLDIAIGTGSRTTEAAAIPDLTPQAAFLFSLPAGGRIIVPIPTERRNRNSSAHALDSPALASLRSIVLLV